MLTRKYTTCLFIAAVVSAASAPADEFPIHLEFRALAQVVNVDDPVALGLWAYTSDGETQLLRALDMVFTWDPAYLRLDGLDADGAVQLLSSGFPAGDPHGLNEIVPPADGDGFYSAWAPLGDAVDVTPAGVLLTTFDFTALAPVDETLVSIAPEGGDPVLTTTIWGGAQANTIVTGDLGFAGVEIIPEPATLLLYLIYACACISRRRVT